MIDSLEIVLFFFFKFFKLIKHFFFCEYNFKIDNRDL